MKAYRRWLYIAPFLLVLTIIFLASSQAYQQQDIRPWLSGDAVDEKLIHWLHGVRFDYNSQEVSVMSMGPDNVAEFIIRKLAHVVLYAALGFTMLMAVWVLLPWKRTTAVCGSLLLTLLFSLFDEYNQQFSPGRTGSLTDVGIDMVGALLGILAFLVASLLYGDKDT